MRVRKIALMRSIVIAGQRVKMADARRLVEKVGGTNVSSIGATGNLLFDSDKRPHDLELQLERECEAFYGRATEMVVKSQDQWRKLLAANPFPEQAVQAPARLLVWAMRTPLTDDGLEQLRRRAVGAERVQRTESGDFYVWFGEGQISRSKIPAGFGLNKLGAIGTNRNWNTAVKIRDALAD